MTTDPQPSNQRETSEALEERLAEALANGTVLDVIPNQSTPVNPRTMESWSRAHDLDARALRSLLRNHTASADPWGLQMRGVRIRGRLDLDNIEIRTALTFYDCYFTEGLTLEDARLFKLGIAGCWLTHPTQPPLNADHIEVESNLKIRESLVVAHNPFGAVRLLGARLRGLDCEGSTIRNDMGPALIADGISVQGSVHLRQGFSARCAHQDGAVRLVGAHVEGPLDCSNGSFANSAGPAIVADQARLDQSVFLNGDTFKAFASAGTSGTVRLLGANIGGQLNFTGSRIANESGPALVADKAEIDGDLFLQSADPVGSSRELVRLAGVRVGGQVLFPTPKDDAKHCSWNLDGMTYPGLPSPNNVKWWLALLRDETADYAPQPYQQLASAYRSAGHDKEARDILIAQRRDQLDRGALTGFWARGWARLTGSLLGFGWKPWRALPWLALVFLVSALLAVCLGEEGALIHPPKPGVPSETCAVIERVGVGLDLGTPILSSITKARDRCIINPDPADAAGVALTVSTWGLEVAAWGLAALFIAGFTSAVRRTY